MVTAHIKIIKRVVDRPQGDGSEKFYLDDDLRASQRPYGKLESLHRLSGIYPLPQQRFSVAYRTTKA